jgi:hypothetical protein
MDTLARKFHETHDMAVKDELERLLREYGELGKPWEFVARWVDAKIEREPALSLHRKHPRLLGCDLDRAVRSQLQNL